MNIKIPKWLSTLPGDARLNSNEMIKIFPYSCVENLVRASHKGLIPNPEKKRIANVPTGYVYLWRVSTVRNFIRHAKIKS